MCGLVVGVTIAIAGVTIIGVTVVVVGVTVIVVGVTVVGVTVVVVGVTEGRVRFFVVVVVVTRLCNRGDLRSEGCFYCGVFGFFGIPGFIRGCRSSFLHFFLLPVVSRHVVEVGGGGFDSV